MKRTPHPDDLTMSYMGRFHCLAADCEDSCCHSWNVEIDERTLKRMKQVTSLHSAAERKRWLGALEEVELSKGKKSVMLKLLPDGRCSMLEDNGLCHVQGTFGEELLSDDCALYPRRVQKVGEAIELSGMVSCPEVARQVLLYADATDIVPLDRRTLFRLTPTHGMDPRDVRPYWRLLLKVRAFMLGLLRRPGYALEQRMFFMTWFAKRTAPILNKSVMKADTTAVLAEMDALDGDDFLDDLARRFDASEATSGITLLLARALVRRQGAGRRRAKFRELVEAVLAEYHGVRSYVPGDLEGADASSHATRLWEEYRKRRARIVERAGARVEQYLANIAHNYWMQRLPLEAPDLMVHMLRLLVLLAVFKFLLFSHPTVVADGDDFEKRLDAAAVEVLYREARYIEHTTLLTDLENALEQVQLRSLAGATYLIRF